MFDMWKETDAHRFSVPSVKTHESWSNLKTAHDRECFFRNANVIHRISFLLAFNILYLCIDCGIKT